MLLFFAGMSLLHSCKIDDFEAPAATLQGTILDNKGRNMQAEQGQGNTKVRLEELSWSSAPVPQDLNIKQDGSYINNKLFAGRYRLNVIEGPFYPTVAQEVEINGTTTHNFQVTPYVDLDWIGEPTLTTDKKISVKFKYVRNEAPNGVTKPAATDYRLFVSTTQYVGNNNFDPGNSLVTVLPAENTEITLTTNSPMKYSTTYYIRVGMRVNDTFKKYNYTTVKTVTVP